MNMTKGWKTDDTRKIEIENHKVKKQYKISYIGAHSSASH